jgi:hypothetical protein
MDTHVKVLGSLQIALGAMGLFGALVLVFVFGGAASAVGASGDPNVNVALPLIGITGMALVTCLAAASIPSIIIGVGLIRLRPWARVAGMVVSLLSLMMIPFGTIVGVYGLWVLFSKDTERLFMAQGASTSSMG